MCICDCNNICLSCRRSNFPIEHLKKVYLKKNVNIGILNVECFEVTADVDFLISDAYFKKSSSMLDDVLRYEKTIIAQEQQIL